MTHPTNTKQELSFEQALTAYSSAHADYAQARLEELYEIDRKEWEAIKSRQELKLAELLSAHSRDIQEAVERERERIASEIEGWDFTVYEGMKEHPRCIGIVSRICAEVARSAPQGDNNR